MNNEQRAIWSGYRKPTEHELKNHANIALHHMSFSDMLLSPIKEKIILKPSQLPDYPNDIAACFRDFVPKLREKYHISSVEFAFGNHGIIMCALWSAPLKPKYEGRGLTESEAFTNAIDKIIEEMK